jgi:hypothetical protein
LREYKRVELIGLNKAVKGKGKGKVYPRTGHGGPEKGVVV